MEFDEKLQQEMIEALKAARAEFDWINGANPTWLSHQHREQYEAAYDLLISPQFAKCLQLIIKVLTKIEKAEAKKEAGR